jgi:glycosyltransferase involved in cell wall biosynthesis
VKLGRKAYQATIEKEKENYFLSDQIVTMCSWVKKSLIEDYGIPNEKISNILPGANITLPSDYNYPKWQNGSGISRDLVLGFVGKDWERKGLPIIIEVKNELKLRGYKIKVKIIGNAPEYIIIDEDVEYYGFIDKQTDADRFIKILSSCDLGCLFSLGEAVGFSILEFFRLGVPVAGYYHQGMLDTFFDGASLRFELNQDIVQVVDGFERYINDEKFQKNIFSKASSFSYQSSWENCIEKWKVIL